MAHEIIVAEASASVAFNLLSAPAALAANVTDIAQPLLETIQSVYGSAAAAVILDVAAKLAAYTAIEESPSWDATLRLQAIIDEQRDLVRDAACEWPRAEIAELLW